MVNVKDSVNGQPGAVADGATDDSAAIQRAINYAKTLSVPGSPTVQYRATVYFPAGYYLIGTSIDLTNTNGIWLVGDGGPYINSIVIGNTGSRPIFDFSGSSLSGCEGFTFIGSTRSTPSTIGLQFALTANGGLNCGIRKCFIELGDVASANGGYGSIGLLNVRSEEFYIHECLIRANTPLVMSCTINLSIVGLTYTASSAYQSLTTGTGSMGVTSVNGTSLQGLQKRQPAIVLLGTNSFNFQGYIGRLVANSGTNETAILCVNYTTNLTIHATIESFSRAIQVRNAGFEGNDLQLVVSNSTSPTTELIDVTGCLVKGLKARISLPNPSERINRYVLYYAPDGGGYGQSAGFITNSEITCYDIPDNQYIISGNLLKKAVNILFNTARPFEKRGGKLRQLTNNNIPAGRAGSVTSAIVMQFREANQLTFNNTNGGYYRIWIDGVVRAGSYGSGGASTLCFQAQIIINQRFDGVFDLPSASVITLDSSVTSPTYLNVLGVLVNLTFTNGIGTVTVTPQVSGSGVSEPVYYNGNVELDADFLANDPILL